MNRINGLAPGLRVAVLMVVVAPCGSDELDTGDGQMESAQALQAAEGSEVTVRGHLIVDSGGNTLLCSVLAESLSNVEATESICWDLMRVLCQNRKRSRGRARY